MLPQALDKEFDAAAGTFTTGKIITALKRLGFDRVFDGDAAAAASDSERYNEIKNGGQSVKPLIVCNSAGAVNFVKRFYPDLASHLSTGRTPRQIFAAAIKDAYARDASTDLSADSSVDLSVDSSKITTVSFTPSIAQKYESGKSNSSGKDVVLTAGEFARMIKLAGIDFAGLQEGSFDAVNLPIQDSAVKKEIVYGFANARKALESIRKGECNAQWVEIVN
jgi:iron only hydrogenase large subunit-like protein